MRKTALDWVYKLAKSDPRVVFIGSDLGFNTLAKFREEMPERFYMEGISEQNIIGMAAGLAMEGRIVYINTIAPFLTRRCYEQVALDVAMANLPVRLIGSGGGMVYAPLGPTHMAIDDISIMRAIPNMGVLAPADATEMARLMPLTLDWEGPLYIRLGKGGDPVVTPQEAQEIGRSVVVAEEGEVLLVTTGITLQIALEAREELERAGIGAAVLHCPSVKPFDSATLLRIARERKTVFVIEENCFAGGLGELTAAALLEGGIQGIRFMRAGIPDVFPDEYGSQNSLLKRYGIDAATIVARIRQERA